MTSNTRRDVVFAPQALDPSFAHIVQILCATYDALDIRMETTLGRAEGDFLSALPEVVGHDEALRRLVRFLMTDARKAAGFAAATADQPVVLRFAYRDKNDLIEQLLPEARSRVVFMPADDATSFHAHA